MTYADVCKQECEWCAKEWPICCSTTTAGKFHQDPVNGGLHKVCTVSSEDTVIERLTTELASANEKLRVAREAIDKVYAEWPDIRQLMDGWKCGTPADEWSEWDERTRQKTVALSFVLLAAINSLSVPQSAQPGSQENS